MDEREVGAVGGLLWAEAQSLGSVGEIGLYHRHGWDDRASARQDEVFRRFLWLAGELRLPVTVHSRGAGRHAVVIATGGRGDDFAVHQQVQAGSPCMPATTDEEGEVVPLDGKRR